MVGTGRLSKHFTDDEKCKITLKPLEAVPKKRNLDLKINNSKLQIWSLSFSLRFFSRKSQNQQKLAEKVTHFTNTVSQKKTLLIILQTFTHLTL